MNIKFKLLIKKIKILFKKRDKYKICAFHESGHIILTYLNRYSVEYVELDTNNIGNGISKIKYNNDNILFIVMAILNFNEDRSFYYSLQSNLYPDVIKIAEKLLAIYTAGCVSEHIEKLMKSDTKSIEPELSGPDLLACNAILDVLNHLNPHNNLTIEKSINENTVLFKEEYFQNLTLLIAYEILNSKNLTLNDKILEKLLKKNNHKQYFF